MNTELMFSSKKQDWTTPRWFFDKYNTIYNFTLDSACESHNKCCVKGFEFDLGINGLEMDWNIESGGGWVWCNPPYGKELSKFIKKAHDEYKKGAKIW